MQTTNHSPQTLAHGLASLGRYGDTYMVHAAEGETVIPAEILQANPRLKADLFRQMQMMGIKDPNRYVVGSSLNSLNPVTGQPEFFYKKVFKAFKSVLPIIGAAVANRIAPGLGSVGAGLGTFAQGKSLGDSLKAMAYTYGTETLGRGIGSLKDPDVGFFDATFDAAKRPFQAASNLFSTGTDNPLAQGMFGQYLPGKLGESAQKFQALNYPDQFYPQYRTAEEMAPRQKELADFWSNQEAFINRPDATNLITQSEIDLNKPYSAQDARAFSQAQPLDISEIKAQADMAPFMKQPSAPFYKQPLFYETVGPVAAAALLEEDPDEEGIISAEDARELGDKEYLDYQTYRSAAPGSEREKARRAAGITPAIDARRIAQSMGISLEAAESYLESMYGGDAGFRNVAGGGEIMGPGTGTSDSIPARLSDGEFVMTADAVRGAGNGNRNVGAARMYDLMSQFEGAA